jgi:hypothetical protein
MFSITARNIAFISALAFMCASVSFAEEGIYGPQSGSIGASVAGGVSIFAGAHPTVGGGVDIGLSRYFGLYGEGTYTLAYRAQVGAFFGGGGVQIAFPNQSRVVPFARFGMDYGQITVFGYGGASIPALRFGGGFDTYVARNFGIETQMEVLHTVGNYGGGNAGAVTFGVFYRSK